MPVEPGQAKLSAGRRWQTPLPEPLTQDLRDRADRHAQEAERLLDGRWVSSHIKGQLHATLALYYLTKLRELDR